MYNKDLDNELFRNIFTLIKFQYTFSRFGKSGENNRTTQGFHRSDCTSSGFPLKKIPTQFFYQLKGVETDIFLDLIVDLHRILLKIFFIQFECGLSSDIVYILKGF